MSLVLVRHYFFRRTFRPQPVKPICFNKDNDLDIVDLLIRKTLQDTSQYQFAAVDS